jgi:hypothetical protein
LNQNTVMVGDMELKDVAFMVFEWLSRIKRSKSSVKIEVLFFS